MKIMKFLPGAICLLVIAVLSAATAIAATTTFSQTILPLDCSVNSVNNGTGTYNYVTPESCVNVIVPAAGQPASDSQVQALIGQSTADQPSPSGLASNKLGLPWQPIAATSQKQANGQTGSTKPKVSTTAVAVTVTSIVVAVILVALIA